MQVIRLAFSPDGKLLAVGCRDGHMHIFEQINRWWVQVSCNKYHSKAVRYIFHILTTKLIIVIIRYSHSASVPLAACCWPQAMTRLLPSGMFHLIPRGPPLLARHSRDTLIKSKEAPLSATSSLGPLIGRSAFGALLMECKLQTMIVVDMCVTRFLLPLLTHVTMQVTSSSYHAASGNIAVGFPKGRVELWRTDFVTATHPIEQRA